MSNEKPSVNPAPQPSSGVFPYVRRRRSTRVWHQTTLIVRTETTGGGQLRDEGQTFAVNAHGGLMTLKNAVDVGQSMVLENPVSQMEARCHVVNVQAIPEGDFKVSFGFEEATPLFWAIAHPPDDWGIRRS